MKLFSLSEGSNVILFQVVSMVISKTQKQEQLLICSGSGETRSIAGAVLDRASGVECGVRYGSARSLRSPY